MISPIKFVRLQALESSDATGGGSTVGHGAFRLLWPEVCSVHLFARTRAIIFEPAFLPVLYDHSKTVTRRLWSLVHVELMQRAHRNGWLVRVWENYGHAYTVGWLLITDMYEEKVGDLTQAECALEGLADKTPCEVIAAYFTSKQIQMKRHEKGLPRVTKDTVCSVVRFIFYPLL